jgi:hypothetical protein
MNLDATIRAVQAKVGVTVDGKAGPKTWDAIHLAIIGERPPADARVLLPSEPAWRFLKVYREGDDIVVPDAIATVFGWDTALGVRDPDDNGECSSGKSTKDHPGLMGCALPVSEARRGSRGSPRSRSRAAAKPSRSNWSITAHRHRRRMIPSPPAST